MNDSFRAFVSAVSIMAFLMMMAFFASTVSAKAGQKVKTMVESEVRVAILPKKITLPKHSPMTIPMDISIKDVNW